MTPLRTLSVLLSISVAALTDLAAGPGVLPVDAGIGRWLQATPIPFGSAIAAFGNAAGSSSAGALLAVAAIAVVALLGCRTDALFLAGLLLARLLNAPLKSWADSPRPPATILRVTEPADGLGFPSGHSMGIVLLAGGLAYVAASALPAGRLRALPWVLATLAILATGYGRIETGAHWPSDVLGGYLWGALILTIAIVLRQRYANLRPTIPDATRAVTAPHQGQRQ